MQVNDVRNKDFPVSVASLTIKVSTDTKVTEKKVSYSAHKSRRKSGAGFLSFLKVDRSVLL